MRTHIAPIYLILGLMAVSALAIGAGNPQARGGEATTQVKLVPGQRFESHRADVRAFQATSPGMAMPAHLVVLVSDKLEGELQVEMEKRVATALAEARARRKAG